MLTVSMLTVSIGVLNLSFDRRECDDGFSFMMETDELNQNIKMFKWRIKTCGDQSCNIETCFKK